LLLPCSPPFRTLFPYTTLFRSGDIETVFGLFDIGRPGDVHIGTHERLVADFEPAMHQPVFLSRIGNRHVRRGLAIGYGGGDLARSEEHTSELQSRENLVCRLLL